MSIEDREDKGKIHHHPHPHPHYPQQRLKLYLLAAASGHGAAQANAFAAGNADTHSKREKGREIGQAQQQGRKTVQKADHLGIEG
jgi:hypothetical protein